MIRIHNSLTGRKEELAPITPGLVRMYVCGITVYDYIHIGHARMLIVFDMVHRYLKSRGLAVKLVQNITDIDDKIIRRAADNGEPMEVLTARFIRAMHEDKARLGILAPGVEPRATQYLPQIVALIARLVEQGYAYQADNGDVMYSVAKFAHYGCLSGKCLADLRAGARVDVVQAKRDPLDFVLWKRAKAGEPSWDSPWGAGRPGWHIECSAMAMAELGGHFDIHGGGLDLKFPHHENEIAQSCAATGERFANLWMHNGFVNAANEKMSKSLGNFFTVREVLPRLRSPEVLRYFMLSCHYRAPIDYSFEQLEVAQAGLGRLYTALRELPQPLHVEPGVHMQRFNEAMDDDFNTPEAIAVLHTLARALNAARDDGDLARAAMLGAQLRALAGTLGLLQSDPLEWFRSSGRCEIAASEVEDLIVARGAARASSDWQEADRIRGRLVDSGVIVEDRPGGATEWRRA